MLLWGLELNTTNLKKTELASKFNNFKIHFNFTLKCSCQCKQSTFQLQRAAGHSWCVPCGRDTITATPWQQPRTPMFLLAPFVSLIQSQVCSPWPENSHRGAALGSCISHMGMYWTGFVAMSNTGCSCEDWTRTDTGWEQPDGCTDPHPAARPVSGSLFSQSVLMCNIYLHMQASVLGNTWLGVVQYVSLSWFKTTYCVMIGLESFPAGEW